MQSTDTQATALATDFDCPMSSEPRSEHAWLHRMLGEWECEGEAVMGPDKPVVKWRSHEAVRSIGGLWVIAEGTGEAPNGKPTTTVITLGYDEREGTYVGTFIASMMSNLCVYTKGSVNDAQTALTLDSEGPSMTGEGTAKYRDIVELIGNDERRLTSFVLTPDGQWSQFMTIVYRRTY